MISPGQCVLEIIADELHLRPEDVRPDLTLVDDLGADSLDYVVIANRIEEDFNIYLPDETLTQLLTVGDFIREVSKTVSPGDETPTKEEK